MRNYKRLLTANDRWRAAAELELRRRARERRAGITAPEFRGNNNIAQTINAREWLLSGPAETGKTFACLWRLDTILRSTPRAQASLVRKLAVDIVPTVLVTYKRVLELSRSGAQAYGGERPEWFQYPNGSRLYLGGIDRPGRILSGERDAIYVNQAEELGLEEWETLTTRVTGRGAVVAHPMLFGDCNPSDPDHWILARARAGVLTLLPTNHADNPMLHDGVDWTVQGRKTLALLDSLTGERYARLRLGEWVVGGEDEAFLPSSILWDACQMSLPSLDRNQPLVLALDAAVSGDTFGLVGVTRNSEGTLVVRLVRIWTPPAGGVIDYTPIETEIRQLADMYNVIHLAYDPYQTHYLAQRLNDCIWCAPFSQMNERLEADRQLLDLILNRRIVHDGDERLREHLLNANRKVDADGRRLRMVKRSANRKIDLAVCLSMAAARALRLFGDYGARGEETRIWRG